MDPRTLCFLLVTATLLPGCGANVAGVDDTFRKPRVPPVLTPMPSLAFEVRAGGATRLDFEVPQAAYLLASVDWTYRDDNVVAVFTGRGCHDINDALAGRCPDPEVQGSPSTCPAKPRNLYTSFYAPVALRLWVANTGTADESGVVGLTLCQDAPDCGATGSCGQCISEALSRRSCAP